VIAWVESDGKPGPKGLLVEAEKGLAELRPLFLFFYATEPAVVDGKKDFEAVKACETVRGEFKVRALANLLREFRCIRLDVKNADPKVLETYGVHETPTCLALDLEGNTVSFLTGAFGWGDVDMDLQDCLEDAEAVVRKLAAGDAKEPRTATAKKRLTRILIREKYAKGEKLFQRARWEKATETFKAILSEGPEGYFFTKRSETMLAEIEAARLYFKAIEDLRAENKEAAREKLEQIVYEMKKAPWFRRFAQVTLGKM
jgi:tetratricopeptide (TPR) repeat protein